MKLVELIYISIIQKQFQTFKQELLAQINSLLFGNNLLDNC
jgi:hypothetical protein